MLSKISVLAFVILFGLSIIASLLISNDSVSLEIILFFLFITTMVLIEEVWKTSQQSARPVSEAALEFRQHSGQFAGAALNLKLATQYSSYSRREIATILREALLNKYSETKDYPTLWIYTDTGTAAIEQILGKENGDLIEIVEPSDRFSKAPRRGLRGRRQDSHYFSKLDRVLRLVESEKI